MPWIGLAEASCRRGIGLHPILPDKTRTVGKKGDPVFVYLLGSLWSARRAGFEQGDLAIALLSAPSHQLLGVTVSVKEPAGCSPCLFAVKSRAVEA